jgi:hypothetical protein
VVQKRPRADRLVTIAVTVFLVLVIGGAVALQLTANPSPVPTPQAPAQAPVTAMPSDTIQRIAVDEAKQLLDKGQAVLLDVRSTESYQAEHAVGAVSFPEGEEAASFDQLPADKLLIFYCT